ncbi:Gfo/Idh/MocA family oxidoreductase [Desulfobacterales bacterium HSG16]|nr:Gfo/Idh/MocA family oxidoreductase [Desulfobacterales bacterium HSG16]
MNKPRIAVIGTGYLGKFHAQKYAGMEEVELVGVADTSFASAQKTARDCSTTAYTDYRDLKDKVDAVSVVVPTNAHFEVSRFFLEHGVDVLIEKPVTNTLKEADALIEKAESKGLIIQVGHLERFNSAVVPLRNIVKKPLFIESHRLSTFKGRGIDVSVVLDLMIHDIDIISNFVQSELTGIHAAGVSVISDHVDIANARLEFASGCVANVTASRISMKDERKIRMFQKDAYISVDFSTHEITIVKKGEGAEDAVIPGMDIQSLNFAKSDALDDELRSFVHSIIHRHTPEVTGQMGREALRIALSIMKQIKKNRNHIQEF